MVVVEGLTHVTAKDLDPKAKDVASTIITGLGNVG